MIVQAHLVVFLALSCIALSHQADSMGVTPRWLSGSAYTPDLSQDTMNCSCTLLKEYTPRKLKEGDPAGELRANIIIKLCVIVSCWVIYQL